MKNIIVYILLITFAITAFADRNFDPNQDYYGDLGLTNKATDEEIKAAFRKLARKYHPDVSTEENATQKFKVVRKAYEVLRDPKKKAAYDRGFSFATDDIRPNEKVPPYSSQENLQQQAFIDFNYRTFLEDGGSYVHLMAKTNPTMIINFTGLSNLFFLEKLLDSRLHQHTTLDVLGKLLVINTVLAKSYTGAFKANGRPYMKLNVSQADLFAQLSVMETGIRLDRVRNEEDMRMNTDRFVSKAYMDFFTAVLRRDLSKDLIGLFNANPEHTQDILKFMSLSQQKKHFLKLFYLVSEQSNSPQLFTTWMKDTLEIQRTILDQKPNLLGQVQLAQLFSNQDLEALKLITKNSNNQILKDMVQTVDEMNKEYDIKRAQSEAGSIKNRAREIMNTLFKKKPQADQTQSTKQQTDSPQKSEAPKTQRPTVLPLALSCKALFASKRYAVPF